MEKELVVKRLVRQAVSVMGAAAVLFLFLFPLKAFALEAGDRAPDFHMINSAGKEISYARDIRGMKPLYLVFWATW